VIARLIPGQGQPLADLIGSGKLRPATLTGPAPRPAGEVRTDHEAGELLRGMREDERY
jgi:hypothetical protein